MPKRPHSGRWFRALGLPPGVQVFDGYRGPVLALLAFNSVERRWAGIVLVVGFVLLLAWPGSRD